MDRDEKDRVRIFDTTLRDGEQSPGISLNRQEKLEIAHQLARLGVDVIEAGFPITSPGDFDAVQAIAREVQGPVICGLARTAKQDIDAAWNAIKDSERAAHPHVHRHQRHPHRAQAADHARGRARDRPAPPSRTRSEYTDDVEFSPEDGSRSDVEFMAEVIQIAIDEGATTINVPDTVGYTMPDEYAEMWRRLYALVPDLDDDHDLGALPQRPRPRGRQLLRRRDGRRAPGRVRGQRHRRARGQRVARGDRDAAAHARVERRRLDRRPHARDRAHVAAGVAPDRLSGAAQQGDRGAQRVRARGRHPPGRRPEGAHHLRDHGRHHDRPRDQLDRARQALRAPCPAQGAGGARLRGRRRGAEHGLQALQGARGQEEEGDGARPRGDRLGRDESRRRPPSRSPRSRSRPRTCARRWRRSRCACPTARWSRGRSPGTGRSTPSSGHQRRDRPRRAAEGVPRVGRHRRAATRSAR